MAKLSVCIEMFWRGEDAAKKVALAKKSGHSAFEFWGWKDKDLPAIKAAAKANKMKLAIFGMSTARPLVDPGAKKDLMAGLKESAKAAKLMGIDRLILTTGNERKAERFEVTRRTVVRNLKALVPILEDTGITLCIEPLNPIRDHLGYWLTTMPDAADICMEIDHPKVKILMDIYHQQITEGNIIENIRQYASLIGHFHCAGVPGRGELVGGELDYRSIFKAIDDVGYDAYIGLEFSPKGDTMKSLAEAKALVS
jgi:hydroxypyruvate isomerase